MVGCVCAAVAAEVEYAPSPLFLVVVGFCFFEVGFYILVALIAKPCGGTRSVKRRMANRAAE